jgi:hypothetical protein
MNLVPATPVLRRLLWAALCAGLVAVAVAAYLGLRSAGNGGVVPRPDDMLVSKAVEYHGVRVTVPGAWKRSDMQRCEFAFEHWAPPGAPACGRGTGVSFYGSATFDPAHGPGVRRGGRHDSTRWNGYVSAGDYVVYVAAQDPTVVRDILASVR